uniref:Uncharacterized protein n=1 Tax=Timema poppense TaxID=170557 RepID=A0A7R9DRR2_TIMPO|nr:unnamed protein product [Timema poppensis]
MTVFWSNWLSFGSRHRPCGGPGDCPDHHCSRDPAVIHGHCCGCGRPSDGISAADDGVSMFVSDRVPVPCYPDLNCPLNGDQLCSDYDYMMDCCC